MPLFIYNSLTRKKEEFKPLHDNSVAMYVCGPTVYGLSHLGHAKSYVSFDVVLRYLRYCRYTVTYVQNITDVGHLTDDADQGEDKIAQQARREKLHPMQVVEMYTREYFADMDAMNIIRPDISPRATGHITEQIEMVQDLLQKGFAYEANGSVYFDVTKDAGYGKLSGRTLDDAESGTRVDVKSEKRNPADFALWKKAEPNHIMQWNSPWGKGFPGWHIECSAMSMKYLGSTFDIHGGGMDNQFPHHECEIAQSECSTGKPFVKYWMHNNLVTVNGQKMGKSLGNFLTLKDAFAKWDPLVIRFFILQSHYRSTLDFSEQAIEGAAKGLEKVQKIYKKIVEQSQKSSSGGYQFNIEPFKTRFFESMNDDFNTAKAIGVLFDFLNSIDNAINEINGDYSSANDFKIISVKSLSEIISFIITSFMEILGLSFDINQKQNSDGTNIESDLMKLVISLRNDARKNKNFAISDKIRDDLKAAGIVLEDGKEGTTWKKE